MQLDFDLSLFIKKWVGNIAVILAVALTSSSIQSAIAAPSTPPQDDVILGTTNLFIPQNFDDNDEVVMVIDTELPSSCYELLEPQYQVDLNNRVISVKAMARRNNRICLPVMTPTSSIIHLGTLPRGDYTVVTNNGWLVEVLPVKEAPTSGPDDYRYADVTDVWLDYAPDLTLAATAAPDNQYRYSAVIEARQRSSCEALDRLELIDSGRTLELLPIMKMTADVECHPVDEVFQTRVLLPEMDNGRYLLHVRASDGQSVNRVVTTYDIGSH